MTPKLMAPCEMGNDESSLASQEQSTDENLIAPEIVSDASFKNLPRHLLSRLVSQEEFDVGAKDWSLQSSSTASCENCQPLSSLSSQAFTSPPLPNPLDDTGILSNHISALRLEADLHPLRLALSRLMAHPTHNRKGMFNHPVDPVALGLGDYHLIVTHPMDLGSIKRKLHAVAYQSRDQVVEDIRLVFGNAMRYNPPNHVVHKCAQELLAYFESYLDGLSPCVSSTVPHHVVLDPAASATHFEPNTSKSSLESVMSDETPVESLPIDAVHSTDQMVVETTPSPSRSAIHDEYTSNETPTSSAFQVTPLSLSKPRVRMPRKRASCSNAQTGVSHACNQCHGRTCLICRQGCLQHEPALLVCCGIHCGGARIRKGAVYYITKDGTHQFCERCHTSLPSTLLHAVQNEAFRYKQELLKRKNDEEIAEEWITCRDCLGGVHSVCAMHNGYVHDSSKYSCPDCGSASTNSSTSNDNNASIWCRIAGVKDDSKYTYVSGVDEPVPMSSIKKSPSPILDSESLKECPISTFIQEKVRLVMRDTPNAEKTINVRVISDCYRQFPVPDVVQRFFRMATTNSNDLVPPPSSVQYRQKAITMFQKIDGLDVCIFCMYVQEYDGESHGDRSLQNKRVYVAYIDSVEHFRPRELRTPVFHEILIAYLATARDRGYQTAQIWACPPSRGNCFVFWNHPASQRTPTKERLLAWYHGALSRAVDFGVVTDVKSLFETDFEKSLSEISHAETDSDIARDCMAKFERMVCPPLVDGDFWIDEAVRILNANIARYLKVRLSTEVCVWNVSSLADSKLDPCPALQIAALLKDRIMTHPASIAFRRPVNAVSLKLKDYHKIVKRPVDLGTIYSRCILGEYYRLGDVVDEVELMVANAKLFNPPSHCVHQQADEVLNLFYSELTALTGLWGFEKSDKPVWVSHADVSMSLDAVVTITGRNHASNAPVVLIEDDRSSDGSRSLASSVAIPRAQSTVKIQSSEEELSVSAVSPTVSKTLNVLIKRKKHRGRSKAEKEVFKKLDILSDGPEAIMQRMVGDDLWLLDKRNPVPPKDLKPAGGKKRGRSSIDVTDEEPQLGKKRRQSWLCEEVGASIRNMRTSFFSCSLTPQACMSDAEVEKLESYRMYISTFRCGDANESVSIPSNLANTRSALLELSQFRHFEFDTLRRAKYSTAMLLYHIHNAHAHGATPTCTTCGKAISEVRWHKVKKICEIRQSSVAAASKAFTATSEERQKLWPPREDLCAACLDEKSYKDDYIPIPVHAHDFQSSS